MLWVLFFYRDVHPYFLLRFKQVKAIMQTSTEKTDPKVGANPIGYSVVGYQIDAIYEMGTRISTIDRKLCPKERIESPMAVKKPLKQK